ncbi:simple sugar transport system permease protein [Tissierella praeacuta]|uniref:ABC transporter permease n=1 Tax=Tissierella praeacuta TaxID=43131 RepID=UPI0010525EA2|nr:ABC transporter permease [Tissierella praeacuta]TCU79244.1 simple sugar transport system permease protein [Tissierella praeacuta]
MLTIMEILFGTVTWSATFRLSTPIILTSIGGSFSKQTGTFCIAFECFMLSAAFFAAWGSYLWGSPYIGAFFAILAGVILAAVFGIFVLHFNANPMIVSIALNFGSWAMTTLLLTKIFKVRGFFHSPQIVNFQPIDIPVLRLIPYVNKVLNNQIILVYIAYISILIGTIVMYKTPFGLRLRGIGINELGAQTSGVNILKYRWIALIIMGVMSGLGGAYMPLSGLSMFSENMTAGRGFLAFAAILVGKGNPLKAALIGMLFAYTNAITLTLTSFGVPTQLLQMMPFVVVILVLIISNLKNFSRKPIIDNQ